MIRAACHCTAVRFAIARPPTWVLDCNWPHRLVLDPLRRAAHAPARAGRLAVGEGRYRARACSGTSMSISRVET